MFKLESDNIETLCAQAGYSPNKSGAPRVIPIIQSTTFYYENCDELADIFDFKRSDYFYTRLGNPTVGALEDKIAAIEGGLGAIAVSSGMAATQMLALNLCSAGDHIVSSQALYGGTYNLFNVTLRRLGIDTTFVSPTASPEEVEAAVRPNTRLIFGETVSNPSCEALNIEAFAKTAKKFGIVFAVDNTLVTPIFCRPFDFGADLVIHSTTKYLDGHATSVGGVIVDSGNFVWDGNPRYPDYNKPDESYHGLVYAKDCGKNAFLTKARGQLLRDLGCCISPFNAFLTILGVETLHLRMPRVYENAVKVADFLSKNERVEFVRFPFLDGSPDLPLSKKYLKGCGGMISVALKGGRDACSRFVSALKLLTNETHVADLHSSVIHPASTTHRQLSAEELVKAGVPENLIRISVGIENVNDILADIEQAFSAM